MSSPAPGGAVPEWDIADRMRKALRTSGVGVQEMADYLGVARNTVSTWINGKITPTRQTQRLWAMRTGVPYEWIRTGKVSNTPQPPSPTTGRYSRNSGTARNSRATPVVALAVAGSEPKVPVAA